MSDIRMWLTRCLIRIWSWDGLCGSSFVDEGTAMSDDLVEKVIDAMSNCGSETVGSRMACAAIAVVLEEAAKVVEFSPDSHTAREMQLMLDKAAAIRALMKEKP